tara:strand:- start:127 stop:468 length:342 start_codon:yes stop_codon:yes gene_type:complete
MDIEKQLEMDVSIDIPFALQSLRPGAQWVLRGEAFSGLEWLDQEQVQPGEQDVLDEIERLKLLKEDLKYRRDRKAEYLTIEEQLDLLYWDGVNGTTTWADHIAEVKANHPKPE